MTRPPGSFGGESLEPVASPAKNAGCRKTDGYVHIGVDGRTYSAHRLAWFYVYGVWPEHDIDHMNGVRGDNRLVNLREATHIQNCRNSRTCRPNKNGFRGVKQTESGYRYEA